jgi:hypothetical protein
MEVLVLGNGVAPPPPFQRMVRPRARQEARFAANLIVLAGNAAQDLYVLVRRLDGDLVGRLGACKTAQSSKTAQ